MTDAAEKKARARARRAGAQARVRRRAAATAMPEPSRLSLRTKAELLLQFAGWGLHWLRRDSHYPSPVRRNRKFVSPHHAVRLIRDGDVIATSGLGGNQRAFQLTTRGMELVQVMPGIDVRRDIVSPTLIATRTAPRMAPVRRSAGARARSHSAR